jgi:hypothetical protein
VRVTRFGSPRIEYCRKEPGAESASSFPRMSKQTTTIARDFASSMCSNRLIASVLPRYSPIHRSNHSGSASCHACSPAIRYCTRHVLASAPSAGVQYRPILSKVHTARGVAD